MKRKIITTADGSKTIQIEQWDEQYHSVHGAIKEANHVYIKHGLLFCLDRISTSERMNTLVNTEIQKSPELSILEIGFGTGLNALLTLLNADDYQMKLRYVGVEAFPITAEEMAALNYVKQLEVPNDGIVFKQMHDLPWEMSKQLTPYFNFKKEQKLFTEITDEDQFDLIYFDAFGARVQPELWTESIFNIMFSALKYNGTLVTYAAKGSVRRAMQSAGFQIEKLAGPPGKREMLRAIKLSV